LSKTEVLDAAQLHDLLLAYQELACDRASHPPRSGGFGVYRAALNSNIHSFFRLQSVTEIAKLYHATSKWFPRRTERGESWRNFEESLKLKAGQWFWGAVNHPSFLRVVWKRMINAVELWEPRDQTILYPYKV
jgi:hypothetical protein